MKNEKMRKATKVGQRVISKDLDLYGMVGEVQWISEREGKAIVRWPHLLLHHGWDLEMGLSLAPIAHLQDSPIYPGDTVHSHSSGALYEVYSVNDSGILCDEEGMELLFLANAAWPKDKHQMVWVNIYQNVYIEEHGVLNYYTSKEEAQAAAACDVIATIKIKLPEGK